MRDYYLYVKDVIEAMDAIAEFTGGLEFEEFRRDDKTSSAVIRKFEIIGEASKNVPANIRRKYPQVPWKEMAGMRDKLIHFYFGVNYELVWQTIKHRIPQIRPVLREIIKSI